MVFERIHFRGRGQVFAGGDDLVERGDGVAGADLAGVLLVVVEILLREQPLFVADEPVAGDLRGVELDLDFHVLGDGHDGAAELLDEHLFRLQQRVEVGGVAVPFAGEFHEHGVLEVAHAEAEHSEKDAALRLLGDHLGQFALVGHAYVPIAVGGEDHAVGAAFDEALLCELVGEFDAARTVGRAAGFEAVERKAHLRFVVRGLEHAAAAAGIDDDPHAVLLAELVDEQAEALLQEREPVRGLHGAGHVDEKDEVARRAFVFRDLAAFEPDADEPVRGRPRAGGDFHRGGERRVALRLRVVVGEVVEQLLDPYRAFGRELPLIEEAADDGVTRGVHIDAEGRERILAHGEKGVVGDRVEGLGVGGLALAKFGAGLLGGVFFVAAVALAVVKSGTLKMGGRAGHRGLGLVAFTSTTVASHGEALSGSALSFCCHDAGWSWWR